MKIISLAVLLLLFIIEKEVSARPCLNCDCHNDDMTCRRENIVGMIKRLQVRGNRFTRVRRLDFRQCTVMDTDLGKIVNELKTLFPLVHYLNLRSTNVECASGVYNGVTVLTDCAPSSKISHTTTQISKIFTAPPRLLFTSTTSFPPSKVDPTAATSSGLFSTIPPSPMATSGNDGRLEDWVVIGIPVTVGVFSIMFILIVIRINVTCCKREARRIDLSMKPVNTDHTILVEDMDEDER